MMKSIIIDTNFLMIPSVFGVDIFSEIERICDFPYQIIVLKGTIDELNNILKNEKGKDKEAARLALQLINKKNLYTPANSTEDRVDDIIFDMADSDTIVATQDSELKKRLKAKNIKLIILRKKSYLKLI